MPKSIAGAYAIAGTTIAIAVIVVTSSTVGLFGGRQTTAAAAAAAVQPGVAQSARALELSSAAVAEGGAGSIAEPGARDEREVEERDHEDREHAERGRAERTGILSFLRNGDD